MPRAWQQLHEFASPNKAHLHRHRHAGMLQTKKETERETERQREEKRGRKERPNVLVINSPDYSLYLPVCLKIKRKVL